MKITQVSAIMAVMPQLRGVSGRGGMCSISALACGNAGIAENATEGGYATRPVTAALLVAALLAWLAGGPASALAQTTAENPPQATQDNQAPATAEEPPWPRVTRLEGETLSVYQPQIEKWDETEISSRAAIAVQSAEGGEPVFGVVWMTANAEVEKDAGVVTFQDFRITKVKFPTAPDKEAQYLEILQQQLPTGVKTISLDRLEASLAVSEAVKKQRGLEVRNDPPRIIFSAIPAVLIPVDGAPVLQPVPNFMADRVVNTRALILRLGASYYLTALNFWYTSLSLDGPWTPLDVPPLILDQVKDAVVAAKQVDLMAPDPGGPAPAKPPMVYVSTVPAELIQTEGQPQMVPIEGTELLQIANSDDAVFMDLNTNLYYVLISGRWFKSKSFYGPWEFVSAKSLPEDFAKIPADHPKANARVSVAGTPEAQEALIANSIPQTATVNRDTAKLDVTYDGTPDFQPIAGTSLSYAVNSPQPVVQVSPNSYYCAQNGVWFGAGAPFGPWVVVTSVPAVIYTIPVGCPIHYVVYCRTYGCKGNRVFVGYTPGYLGTIVSSDGVVVYGTGYRYRPHVGHIWVGYPWTYGFGAGFACGWNCGFQFGFSAAVVNGGCPHPWWGPFGWGRTHDFNYSRVSVNHVNIYRHWSNAIVISGSHVDRTGRAENRRGPDGDRWRSLTPFNPYSARSRPASRTPEAPRPAAPPASPPTQDLSAPNRAIAAMNNVFAGRDGQVYRLLPTNEWEQRTKTGWQNAAQNRTFQREAPDLNRENTSRQIADVRAGEMTVTKFPVPRFTTPVTPPFTPPSDFRGGIKGR